MYYYKIMDYDDYAEKVQKHLYMYVDTHMSIHTIHKYASVCIHIAYVYTNEHTCIHMHTYTRKSIHIYVYASMYIFPKIKYAYKTCMYI